MRLAARPPRHATSASHVRSALNPHAPSACFHTLDSTYIHVHFIRPQDNGKPIFYSRAADVPLSIDHFRYFAGWADKIHGKTIPVDGPYMAYTLHEPIGVVGQVLGHFEKARLAGLTPKPMSLPA
jgi:hypothetical protein